MNRKKTNRFLSAINISIKKQVKNLLYNLCNPRIKFLFNIGNWNSDKEVKIKKNTYHI